MNTQLEFTEVSAALAEADALVVVGRRERLLADDVRSALPDDVAELWPAMVEEASPGDNGAANTTWRRGDISRVVAAVLPEPCSRHNSPARPHAIASLVSSHAPSKGHVAVLLALDEPDHAFAAGCAVARALPEYSRKQQKEPLARNVYVAFLTEQRVDVPRIEAAAEGIRLAARLVDTPTSELNTDAFVELARDYAVKLGADIMVMQGEDLAHANMGGLWNVGKAAVSPPALVVLEHTPPGTAKEGNIVWVGKGIVYDTGGLSIKTKTGMPGMKGDMGGAAAVLGAFVAAVKLGIKRPIRAILCLAENSVGPHSMRPDDIITPYSGRTVEVNNTDAEGRLVLADGVAYATRHLKPAALIDLATLTGAQSYATGNKHAAIMANDEAIERAAIEAGRASGDLVHPLPYIPEFVRGEFKSKVADMKNSAKDKSNAGSAAAGQFIGEHLVDYDGPWLHCDIAAPSGDAERGTGYGVALLLELLEHYEP